MFHSQNIFYFYFIFRYLWSSTHWLIARKLNKHWPEESSPTELWLRPTMNLINTTDENSKCAFIPVNFMTQQSKHWQSYFGKKKCCSSVWLPVFRCQIIFMPLDWMIGGILSEVCSSVHTHVTVDLFKVQCSCIFSGSSIFRWHRWPLCGLDPVVLDDPYGEGAAFHSNIRFYGKHWSHQFSLCFFRCVKLTCTCNCIIKVCPDTDQNVRFLLISFLFWIASCCVKLAF